MLLQPMVARCTTNSFLPKYVEDLNNENQIIPISQGCTTFCHCLLHYFALHEVWLSMSSSYIYEICQIK